MTTFKSLIGSKDEKFWDGVTRTFTRRTSSGGNLTQNKLGSVCDILEVYGSGDTYTDATLSAAISAIGSNVCTILFQPGTWVIANDVTIPATISIMVPQGATLSVSTTKTLTVSGNIIAGSYVIFDGAGSIAGSPILTFKDSYWFSGTVTDSTTPTYKAITEGAITATSLSTDTISEKTAAAGVTIDGVKLKDSEPYCDVINEKTTATGVTIDSCLIKDGAANIANGESVLAADFTLNQANGTFQDTGLSISLSAAGTYKIYGNIKASINFSAGADGYVVVKLYNSTDAAYVTNSERILAYSETTNKSFVDMSPMDITITIAAAKTIQLHAARFDAGTWVSSTISSGASGRTNLGYIRLA